MKATVKTTALLAVAILGIAGAAWAVPVVDNVNMSQVPGTRKVKIDYTLTGTEDAIVTVSIETNGIALPDSAVTRLSGDVCKVVQPGSRTMLWDAGTDWPDHVTPTAKARVTAWSVDAPPLYCVVDLAGGTSAVTYPVYYYTSAEALPYGGLTNVIFKSSYLVMRKITNGAFNMGEGSVCRVVLTKDFYTGVFPVTQGQWAQVMGTTRSAYFTDVSSRLYRPIRADASNFLRQSPARLDPSFHSGR